MTDPTILASIQSHPFSQGLLPEHCTTLAALGSHVSYGKDDVIFTEGDLRHEFFFLLKGRVALEMMAQGMALRVHTLDAGDELGWSSVLSGRGKFYQARAIEPVEAIRFDGHELLEKCRSDNAFGYKIMHRLVGVVSERLQAARMQVLDMYSPIAKKAGA